MTATARDEADQPTRSVQWVHAGSMVAAAVYLVVSARGAQFYADDWAFLARLVDGGPTVGWLLEPHNEHWTLLPKLVYASVAAVAGTASVWPFLVVTFALHLILCHLLWRFAVARGADPVLATLACAGFAVYATGVENILWAFQTGLVGNLVLGLLTMLEVARERPRGWLVALLGVLNVMTSGIALVFLGLTVLGLLARRRPHLLWTVVPASALAAVWYLVLAPTVSGDPRGGGQLALLPVYWALGLGNAVAGIVPFRTPGQAVFPSSAPTTVPVVLLGFVGLVLVVVLVARRRRLRPDAMTTVLALGAPTFVLMTSLSRISYGLGTSLLSRYAYVATAFVLPWLMVVVSRAVRDRARLRRGAVATFALLLVANAVSWWSVSAEWTSWARTTARIMTAGHELVASGAPVYGDSTQTPEFAFLTPRQVGLLDLGRPAGEPTAQDRLSADLGARTRLVDVDAAGLTCGPAATTATLPLGDGSVVVATSSATVDTTLVAADGSRSHDRSSTLAAGGHRIETLGVTGQVFVSAQDGAAVLRTCTD